MEVVRKLIIITVALVIVFIAQSCTTDANDILNAQIKRSLRNDNSIDKIELETLTSTITKYKNQLEPLLTPEGIPDNNLLKLRIKQVSKLLGSENEPEIYNTAAAANEKTFLKKLNVFIENSASMDGYVAKTTDFEAALSDLLVQSIYKYGKQKLHVNFINSRIYPSEITEVEDFINALDPSGGPYIVGNRTSSKLNSILDSILKQTSKNDISILISDCIYSLGSNKDTEGALQFQKSLTKGVILQKSKEFDLTTAIFKMESNFNGNYYDKNNGVIKLRNSKRPYYIWLTGATSLINDFLDHISITKLEGYQNQYILEPRTGNSSPYYTILKVTGKKGDFRQTNRMAKQIKEIEDIEFRRGQFTFSIAVDMSQVKTDPDYYMDKDNYEVSSGFSLLNIEKVSQETVQNRDFKALEKTTATHYLTFSLAPEAGIKDLEFSLKKEMPEWINTSSTINDKDIKLIPDKTFGLSFLISGVSEAYKTLNGNFNNHLTINIIINP